MSRGRSRITSSQAFIGLQAGYIVLPNDVDRTLFIEQCYRWERVSILVERGGGMIHDCYITRTAMAGIEFPETSSQLGSCVVFFTDPFSALPIIIGVLSKEDESQLLSEGVFKITKSYQGGTVTVSGDAKAGVISLAVSGGTVSQINLSATNGTTSPIINVRSGGNVNIEAGGNVTVVAEQFKVNGGTEPMVLGDTLKTELDKTNVLLQALIDIINGASIPEPGNGAPSALQLALQTAIATKTLGDYSDINSLESFLD